MTAPAPSSRTTRTLVPLLLLALLGGHLFWLLAHTEPAYASPDADGYFAQARLMATEQRLSFRAESPVQYVPMHWLETEDGRFFSRYPPGYPAMVAAAYRVGAEFGAAESAAIHTTPVLATLCVLLFFLVCLPRVGAWPALGAATLLATDANTNQMAVMHFAHTGSVFCLLAGLLLLDAWGRRPAVWKVVLAGVALGTMPTVRYAEAAAALGIGVYVLMQARRHGRWSHVAWALLGALVPVGAQLAVNQLAFGSPWMTGYSLTQEQQSLSWESLQEHFWPYVDGLGTESPGLLFGIGLAGVAAMVAVRETRPLGLLCGLGAAGIVGAYMAYYWMPSMRFLIPVTPLLLLPAVWLLRGATAPRIAAVALATLVVLQGARGGRESEQHMARQADAAHRATLVLDTLRDHVPAGSILLADRRIQESLHWRGTWRLADAELLATRGRGFGGLAGGGFRGARGPAGAAFGPGGDPDDEGDDRPQRASPMQVGKAAGLRARYEGLSPEARSTLALDDLLEWAGSGHTVYWLTTPAAVERLADRAELATAFEEIATVALPPAAATEERRGRPGGRFGGMGGPGGRGGLGGRSRSGGPGIADMFGPPSDTTLSLYRLDL